jgi:Flp pilus assembly protein TadD/uncharacterized protein (AIM24 family)
VARPLGAGEEEVEGLDEEFVYHLSRGSELLARGELEAARSSLERASELRPRDPQVLGLLGQALYKLGRFEESAGAYGRLVDDNPTEASARVNLGLALLKAKRFADAVKQLGIALDLNPDHRKAMGYLGLAHFESGDARTAREWFARAGKTMMVARCDEVLASPGGVLPAPPQLHETQTVEMPLPRPAAVEPAAAPAPAAEPAPVAEATPAVAPAPAPPREAPATLAAYTARSAFEPPTGAPFALDEHTLAVAVRGEVMCRLDGLFAVRGALRLLPALKRFRGRATDKSFGEGPSRMYRASGEGTLLLRTGGRRFTDLELAGEAGYFREDAVFAFEDSATYENGRVSSRLSADLDLVHLRGRGRLLVVTEGEPVLLEVTAGEPLRVPEVALIGWVGGLTPRVLPIAEPAAGGEPAEGTWQVVVELTGQGRAIVDPAAAWPRPA